MNEPTAPFSALTALKTTTRVNENKHSKAVDYANEIVLQLDAQIRQRALDGDMACEWSVPLGECEKHPDFDLNVTRRAIRHYLREGNYTWQQDAPNPQEYTVRWSPPMYWGGGRCVVM